MKIPVISLWQPWASLVARGVKSIETRHEPAPAELVGRRVAIYAAAKDSRPQVYQWLARCHGKELERALAGRGWEELPRGCVLAVATLKETRPADFRDLPETLSPVEDFYAWVLSEIELLPTPLEFAAPGSGPFEVEISC